MKIDLTTDKVYDLIYSDPPWRYDFSSTDNRKIENQYQTMTVEDIKALKVPSAKNSVCYLWATAPKLIEGLDVLKAWGFSYKSCMIWDKEIVGMGYWFRGQHEILLVGTKGKFSPPSQSLRVSSVLRSRRTKHSQKPFIVRKWINKWYPEASKLEMFARNSEVGWDCFGLEAPQI